jgi:hypothetical protein
MNTQNTTTGAGNLTAAQRIVLHPDGDGFALLDIYGDYCRSHHGFVWKCGSKKIAAWLLGCLDEKHPLI